MHGVYEIYMHGVYEISTKALSENWVDVIPAFHAQAAEG